MTRGQFESFRSGNFYSRHVQFTDGWVLDDDVQPLFPVPSCVLFGRAGRGLGKPLPDTVRRYSGTLPIRDASEAVADEHLKLIKRAPRPTEASYDEGSVYRTVFRDGATLYPRLLCLVERVTVGRIGTNPKAPLVRSWRSTQEKAPWKALEGIEHAVEAKFLRPVLLGESIVPFRVFRPFEGVVPVDDGGTILDAELAARRGKSGLAGWMAEAEKTWEANKTAQAALVGQFDYYGKLGSQFPTYRSRASMPTRSCTRISLRRAARRRRSPQESISPTTSTSRPPAAACAKRWQSRALPSASTLWWRVFLRRG
jgi:hypothetical protein